MSAGLVALKGEFNFDLHALKRIDYIGVTFRTRTLEEVREIVRRCAPICGRRIEAGKLSLPIYKTFKLADIADAPGDDASQPALRQDRHQCLVVE